ncbi:hypothetical protein NECAME_04993 [Necator americanus]|uniref:DM13 domain-containing protein n=1 Tax=Necator americanus TaxID=51031 RepID=W2SN89_NECAM|nr:hypothetical protein NECAME_04993 [Necator americanus]ETN70172.1 hypothetical protein NECAME_04993 [Necator americanus]
MIMVEFLEIILENVSEMSTDCGDRYISSVELNKEAPHPTCCIRDPNRDVITGHYGTRLNPIAIIDAQTLLLQKFTIEGSKPPDAWIYAGRGEINQENGKKAFIIGRDSPAQISEIHKGAMELRWVHELNRDRACAIHNIDKTRQYVEQLQKTDITFPCSHCSINEDWTNQDITVRLVEGQTVYDIEWISVFCYNYSVDFAHLPVNLTKNVNFVPAYLPEFRKTAPFRERRRKCPQKI